MVDGVTIIYLHPLAVRATKAADSIDDVLTNAYSTPGGWRGMMEEASATLRLLARYIEDTNQDML